MSIEHVLCPVDFSVASGHAYQAAHRLAETFDARFTVIHVHGSGVGEEEARAELATFLDTWSQADAHDEVVILDGGSAPAAYALVDWARDHEIDLIVSGTHGRTGLDRVLLGSFAEKIVRLAPCPVWVVRANETQLHPHRILHPTDFSPVSAQALEWAVYLAIGFAAELHIIHILHRPQFHTGEDEALDAIYETARHKAVEHLAKLGEAGSVSIATSVHVGYPAKKIVEVANDQESDLIVCGTRGLTGLERDQLGSVAERVVRLAPCSVLTVRSKRTPGAVTES